MNHLSDDQIYRLAELSVEMQAFGEDELTQMDHLKTCEACYDAYCVMQAMMEATSENGLAYFSEHVGSVRQDASAPAAEKLLAIVRVAREKVRDAVSVVMEQVESMGAELQFASPLTVGARGAGGKLQTVFKLEEIEDERTFVVFDVEKHELMVQINVKNVGTEEINVHLVFEDGKGMKVPMKKQGDSVKGTLSDVPEGNFEIRIG